MNRLSVLVVDDELGMRKGATRVLERLKVHLPETDDRVAFDVTMADCGEQAWKHMDEQLFDLLLLDYKLPDTTGLEILEELHNRKTRPMTIMMTAYASLEVAVSATKNGAFDFLAKPFSPEELKSVVTKATRSLIAMQKAQALAEEKRKMRFQFLSVLSHELKAPLAAVEGYLYNLRDHALGEDLSSYDKCIQRSLIRIEGMRKLIFDLLDLTRIESGQKRRELQKVRVFDAIEMAMENVATAAANREIRISFEGDRDIEMTADLNELLIMANNLITNAVKYNKDKGSVTIKLTENDQTISISVSDTGYGMTRDEQAHLFDEFVRIRNDQTRGIEGSGLGLSILKKLSRLYGGDIEVQSESQVGSRFTVVLQKDAPEENITKSPDEIQLEISQ